MIDLALDRVSKMYRVSHVLKNGARRNKLFGGIMARRRQTEEFWALRDVSFTVKRGEALGVIGHNGAGKSTILKLLSGITTPTRGRITISGHLSALIEVGSGFHPDLTGLENVYLSGSLLGMRRREIAQKLDRIVDFAGVTHFIDMPVKFYSSGMYVRLGFSIAAHLNPDILLLDEVMAVGDAAFQLKCTERINQLRERGTTIVFISHDLESIKRICGRVQLMHRGELVASGEPREVISQYNRLTTRDTDPDNLVAADEDHLKAEVRSLTCHDAAGHESLTYLTGQPLTVKLRYVARESLQDVAFYVYFYNEDWILCSHFTTQREGPVINLNPGEGAIEFSCPELGLKPGIYFTDVVIKRRDAAPGVEIHWLARCSTILVSEGNKTPGAFYMPHTWRFTPEAKTPT